MATNGVKKIHCGYGSLAIEAEKYERLKHEPSGDWNAGVERTWLIVCVLVAVITSTQIAVSRILNPTVAQQLAMGCLKTKLMARLLLADVLIDRQICV
ncbi:uncharacterized protein EAE97_011635 [Botrytis byssoidea]|uniref:Uncharacterized protein n=1 Tax=Botrytis byssoidea TaxID=139641 RepID=A0A9P5I0P7_9HELO|nr:uncharacterized protein EAE97_011635 [Botrytis byssoidea]KAF7919717.1 hypothetical protein EAE97_011635 [Botrytis byssoidea]